MNRATTEAAISQNQQRLVEVLDPLAAGADSYALIDFPDHSNVGDSAIYVGERKLLQQLFGKAPCYVSSLKSHNNADLDTDGPAPLIFLHGGGNFGDVWPKHQNFRETVIAARPNNKVVQLPQSIHFSDAKARDACAKIINAHPDFTLLVRDHESYALAKKYFDCTVHLCPDSAFFIGSLQRTAPVSESLLSLIRTDSESRFAPDDYAVLKTLGPVEDWVVDTLKMKSKTDRSLEKLSIKSKLGGKLLQNQRLAIYDKWAEERVARGVKQLSQAKVILTDRLHVHILSSLLGIPHVVLDNNYGKISRYMAAWPDTGTATLEMDLRKAMTHAQNIGT